MIYGKVCGMTENVNNLYFLVKKGEEFREENIINDVKKYIKNRFVRYYTI
jgi:hypothetical protein